MDSAELLEDKDWRDDAALVFPDSVLNAIDELLPDTEQLDEPRFDTTDYINRLFPTEQSLSNIDSVVAKMEYKMSSIDEDIQDLVRSEVASRDDGHKSLEEARERIRQLAVQVRDINKKAEKSEEMVREITSEIKQLDCAKTNLTAAITTLNHFHMLVGGIDSLRQLTQKHLYKEIVLPLQAIMEVMKHFETYKDIKQINDLRDEVQRIRADLATQILADFKDAFTGTKSNVPHRTLAEACLVVTVLDRKIKNDLLKWFIGIQLQEYVHLFSPNQETAWLDKIDKRYAWLKKHLIEFERSPGGIFPPEWQLSELIAVEFCRVTKAELTELMSSRKQEIDVKLLLYAIQKTYNFETLLDKRFTGETFESEPESPSPAAQVKKSSSAVFDSEDKQATSPQDDAPKPESTKKSPFIGLIGACFEPHLSLYIDSLDTNLSELTDRFVQDAKQTSQQDAPEQPGAVFTSCADLFLFYKKCMVQCTQLTTGKPMLDLAAVFQKYLHKYAVSVLQASLPKQSQSTLASQVSYIGAGGILNNLHSLLKEDECGFNKQEISRITSVITTSEYCLETTIHLEQKLKEKVSPSLADKIDLTQEQDLFHKIISNCIQILVQDLEFTCEPSLTAMAKISWQSIDSVGDQSGYINQIILHLKSYIPTLRNNLASSRKYFTQFCIRFANSFIPKFIQNIYKCKPISTVGSEQLLLDTHMLKTVLLDLPSIGSDVKRQAPATYTKVVIKMMTKAEMILKLVMSPLDLSPGSMDNFVSQFVKLLPECTISEFHKVLDMKGVKKVQMGNLDAIFKEKCRLSSNEAK